MTRSSAVADLCVYEIPVSISAATLLIEFVCRQSHTRQTSEHSDALHKVDSTTVDLCSGSEIATDTLFITNHLTLVWSPPDSGLAAKMVSERLIITVFGTGTYNAISWRWPSSQRTGGRATGRCIVRRVLCLKTAVIGRLNPAKQGLKMGCSSWSTAPVLCAPVKVCYIVYECPSAFLLATSWTVRGSNPGGTEIFRTRQDWPWDPPSLFYRGYRLSFVGRGVDQPPPYT